MKSVRFLPWICWMKAGTFSIFSILSDFMTPVMERPQETDLLLEKPPIPRSSWLAVVPVIILLWLEIILMKNTLESLMRMKTTNFEWLNNFIIILRTTLAIFQNSSKSCVNLGFMMTKIWKNVSSSLRTLSKKLEPIQMASFGWINASLMSNYLNNVKEVCLIQISFLNLSKLNSQPTECEISRHLMKEIMFQIH